MRLGITGATSIVGQELCDFVKAHGHEVVRLIRFPIEKSDRHFDIYKQTQSCDLLDLDALVHLAWARDEDSERSTLANIEATEYLAAQCAAQNTQFVFVSSTAVLNAGSSRYGDAKLQAEETTRTFNGIVVRPGIIWGGELKRSPIFQQLAQIADTPLVLPTISPDPILYHSEISALCRTLMWAADLRSLHSETIHAFASDQIALSAILKAIRTRRCIAVIHLPIGLCLFLLRLINKLRIPIGIRMESLEFALPSKRHVRAPDDPLPSGKFSDRNASNLIDWLEKTSQA